MAEKKFDFPDPLRPTRRFNPALFRGKGGEGREKEEEDATIFWEEGQRGEERERKEGTYLNGSTTVSSR